MNYSISEIKELMREMAALGLNSVEIEDEGSAIRLAIDNFQCVNSQQQPPVMPRGTEYEPPEPITADELFQRGNLVTAPIVGTFYSSPNPDSPPFVKIGDIVNAGDVLFIIESMKLMNEVTAEYDGAVTEILVKNGESLEYGQPVMRIE